MQMGWATVALASDARYTKYMYLLSNILYFVERLGNTRNSHFYIMKNVCFIQIGNTNCLIVDILYFNFIISIFNLLFYLNHLYIIILDPSPKSSNSPMAICVIENATQIKFVLSLAMSHIIHRTYTHQFRQQKRAKWWVRTRCLLEQAIWLSTHVHA